MLNQILSLSKTLISLPSTTDNLEALNQTLEIAKRELKGYTLEEFTKEGTSSLLLYNTPTRPTKFRIILNAHLDVVPGKKEQFKPYEKKGKLYGRGTYDMKGAAASAILVFKELAKKLPYPIALQLVTDEEIGGFNGTKYQIEKGVRGDFIIAGEPTDFGINNQAKGIIWLKIKIKGKTAHGAYLWQGENALLKTIKIIEKIYRLLPYPKKEVWRSTANLAKIETSNQTFNKVAHDCICSFDIRYIPKDKEKIIEKLTKIVEKDGNTEIVLKEPCQFTDKNNHYIKILKRAVHRVTKKNTSVIVKHGGSDVRHYNAIGCPGVTFGPVGFGPHTDNEWVDIKSLISYYQILKEFLLAS